MPVEMHIFMSFSIHFVEKIHALAEVHLIVMYSNTMKLFVISNTNYKTMTKKVNVSKHD